MWQRRIRQVAASERRALDEGIVMAEFTEASRHAESFPEAIRMALAMLRETIGAMSAVLLEETANSFLLNRQDYPAPVTFHEDDFRA